MECFFDFSRIGLQLCTCITWIASAHFFSYLCIIWWNLNAENSFKPSTEKTYRYFKDW